MAWHRFLGFRQHARLGRCDWSTRRSDRHGVRHGRLQHACRVGRAGECVCVCVCVCVCFPCVSVLAKNENISSVVLLMPGGEWRVHRRVKRRNASEGEETELSGVRSRADLS